MSKKIADRRLAHYRSIRDGKSGALAECERMRKANPREEFRVKFCRDAGEWITQVNNEKEWLCLH